MIQINTLNKIFHRVSLQIRQWLQLTIQSYMQQFEVSNQEIS